MIHNKLFYERPPIPHHHKGMELYQDFLSMAQNH